MEDFEGKFEFVSSYGVDEYLAALGVGHVLRKVYASAKPIVEITKIQSHEGQPSKKWNFKVTSVLYVHEVDLKINEGVEDETLDARPCSTILIIQPPGVLLHQIPKEGLEVKVTLTKHAGNTEVITISHNAGNKYICSFEFKRCS